MPTLLQAKPESKINAKQTRWSLLCIKWMNKNRHGHCPSITSVHVDVRQNYTHKNILYMNSKLLKVHKLSSSAWISGLYISGLYNYLQWRCHTMACPGRIPPPWMSPWLPPWQSEVLPPVIRLANSVDSFKAQLKTHLFAKAYPS